MVVIAVRIGATEHEGGVGAGDVAHADLVDEALEGTGLAATVAGFVADCRYPRESARKSCRHLAGASEVGGGRAGVEAGPVELQVVGGGFVAIIADRDVEPLALDRRMGAGSRQLGSSGLRLLPGRDADPRRC